MSHCSLVSSSLGTGVVHPELLMVVLGYQFLDVGQFVVEIFTATLVLVVVWIGL